MRIGLLAIVSGVALSLSAAAWASETQSGSEQTVSAKNDSEKIVCHYVAHEGVLIPKPFCGTQYQWDRERRRAQQALREYQLRAAQLRAM
jgi:hypothetical protein